MSAFGELLMGYRHRLMSRAPHHFSGGWLVERG